MEHYSLHWGDESRGKCVSLGFIKDVQKDASATELAENTPVPDSATHVLAFSANVLGRSDFCAATKIEDAGAEKKAEL